MKTYWDSSALIEAIEDPAIRGRIKPGDNATRSHALSELFSTLTKGANYRYSPADAAAMIADLKTDMTFVDLTADEMLDAINRASSLGVRGARIHDLMHAWAAKKWQADVLLTLDRSGFSTLKVPVKIEEP
ncbi:MAG: type II toxin-antitoxin system VapC family toxin [Limisphaerales bacterium]